MKKEERLRKPSMKKQTSQNVNPIYKIILSKSKQKSEREA